MKAAHCGKIPFLSKIIEKFFDLRYLNFRAIFFFENSLILEFEFFDKNKIFAAVCSTQITNYSLLLGLRFQVGQNPDSVPLTTFP